MEQVPEEGKQLGKIAYTLLCNRGVYPMPQQGPGRRDSVCEFASMTGILRECVAQMVVQMVVLETGGGKIDPDLRAMVNKWAEVGRDVASKIFSGHQVMETFEITI